MKSPQRGEVWLVDLGMAAKVRPALAISVAVEDIDRALVTLVPHTTSPRQSRFEVAVSVPFLRVGVFDAQNLVTRHCMSGQSTEMSSSQWPGVGRGRRSRLAGRRANRRICSRRRLDRS